ncbi:heme exporter protein CcmD, partial [Xanthomonas oryzae pv. oryzae]
QLQRQAPRPARDQPAPVLEREAP